MVKKIIKKNYKFVLGIITGLTISTIVAYATTIYEGSIISYDNSNSTLSSTDVQGALDELYGVCTGVNSLYNIIASNAVMDNTSSAYVTSTSGIDFSSISSDTNGKGVYIRSGKGIYYYRGAVENNNVLFAGFCWKIVRTTVTGGVKLIYNGTSTDGTCDNTGSNSQIGTSAFNSSYDSLAYVGYMYGNTYTYSNKTTVSSDTKKLYTETINVSNYSASDYIFADESSVTWTSAKYKYSSGSSSALSESVVGKYTCLVSNAESSTYSRACVDIYYIIGYNSSNSNIYYVIKYSGGSFASDEWLTVGNSYSLSSDGIFTVVNTKNVTVAAWVSNYSKYNNYYTCGTTSESCSSLWRIYSLKSYSFSYVMSNLIVIGNDVSFANDTYTLSSTSQSIFWASDTSKLNSNHYTCFSTDTTCSTVYYIYYAGSNFAYYISLTGGKTVENVLDEMLTSSNNSTNSTIKTTIDTWYETNMTDYTNKLEDTVWCNDRSINALNGWDPNGGSITNNLYFAPRVRAYTTYTPSLECSNTNDSFTVSSANGNGDLTYPVALLTSDEIMLAGGNLNTSNSSYYLYTGSAWWTLSPGRGGSSCPLSFDVDSGGILYVSSVYSSYGVRPSVSLKSRILITGGDGTVSSPYTVES